MEKLIPVGEITEEISSFLGSDIKGEIYQSEGLIVHIRSRHPGCVDYLSSIPEIIKDPDYIGASPREKGVSFELVKCLSDNVQIGIKFDKGNEYFYVATLYTITDAKLSARVSSGRLHKL